MSASRPRSLRRRLTRNLVGLALVSVLLLAVINFFVARDLLDDGVEEQLSSLRDVRAAAIERGVARIENRVAALARDPGVVQALADLAAGYESSDLELSAAQIDELEATYERDVLSLYDEAGVERPDASSLVPESAAGRYVQYEYIATNPSGPGERSELEDAGDGSPYSAAHAQHHRYLLDVLGTTLGTDLLLASTDDEIVYSTAKRIDLGTNAVDGPYRDAGLGEALVDRLPRTTVGDAVAVDAAFYLPAAGESPVVFFAASARETSEVVGAVILAVPIDLLTRLTTADGQWDELGLDDTGELYVVGSDLTLRSDPRQWLEDPDEYLRRFEDRTGDTETADLIRLTGSPVLFQQVDNPAVAAALDGDEFVGRVDSYLGTRTLAAAEPLNLRGLGWVVVAEQATSESRDALESFVGRLLVLLAILLPVAAVVAAYLARVFTRPVGPLVGAASRIAEGDLEPDLPDLGRNELGDLSRQLEGVADTLRAQETAIEVEERRINEMLGAVLPERLAERVRRGEARISDLVDTATVVSLTLVGLPDAQTYGQEALVDLTSRVTDALDELVAEHGLERVRASSGQQIFLAGLGGPALDTEVAFRFASQATTAVAEIGAEAGVDLAARAGVASGDVATGVIGSTQTTFSAWGEPVETAGLLDALAQGGEVLTTAETAAALDATWVAEPVDHAAVVDLDVVAVRPVRVHEPSLDDGAAVPADPS